MSIYPEGSEPRGADSTNQLLLKYAEELIATQYVDPHGFSIYPTGGATDNAIKTGDSLQNILAKLLGASQGGYKAVDLSGAKLATISLYSEEPPPYNLTENETDVFISTGSDPYSITLPVIAQMPPDSREANYFGPFRVSVSSGSTVGTTVQGVAVGLGEVIEYMFGDGVWTYKLYQAPTGTLALTSDIPTLQSLTSLTEYADDAAAGVGGLSANDLYTTTGTIKIKL